MTKTEKTIAKEQKELEKWKKMKNEGQEDTVSQNRKKVQQNIPCISGDYHIQ